MIFLAAMGATAYLFWMAGAGMIHTIVFRVGSEAALDFWAERLGREGIETGRDGDRLGFADFEGLGLEFHERVRKGYWAIQAREPGRVRLVDASRTEEAVAAELRALVEGCLGLGVR